MKKPKHHINAEQAIAIAKSVFNSHPDVQRLIQKYSPREVSLGLTGAHRGSDQFEICLCIGDVPLNENEINNIDTTGNSADPPMPTIARLFMNRLIGSFELEIMNETDRT